MKRNTAKKLIIIAIIISVLLIIDNFIIMTRIHYEINYEVNLLDSNQLIEKVESFDFIKYCRLRDDFGETHNLSKSDYYYHIDGEYIDYLKEKVNRDFWTFHLWPFHYHYFIYSFIATEESELYFTYNNNSVIKAQYENYEEIFVAEYDYDNYDRKFWIGNWYVNFTQVPYVSNISSTILLNNTILIKILLEYDYCFGNVGGEFLDIEQILVLDSNLQIIFVYIPLITLIVA